MARGNRRETIFHDDDDRRFFLATLSEACAMTGWRVHAWVLMGNHYHLFIETPEANLVVGMSPFSHFPAGHARGVPPRVLHAKRNY
jgi:REP element-mobilizing transposase RayT